MRFFTIACSWIALRLASITIMISGFMRIFMCKRVRLYNIFALQVKRADVEEARMYRVHGWSETRAGM